MRSVAAEYPGRYVPGAQLAIVEADDGLRVGRNMSFN